MIKFDIPYFPTSEYNSFVVKNKDYISSLYFTGFSYLFADARYSRLPSNLNEDDLINQLIELNSLLPEKSIKRILLLNTRVHVPSYYNTDNTKNTLNILDRLLQNNIIDGIIYNDQYYINYLSKQSGEICSQLEAIPSINWMFDNIDKVNQFHLYLSNTKFKNPSKIIIDRSLNRNISHLKIFIDQIKSSFNVDIELLANEGCLYQCPFKVSHDCYISLTHNCSSFSNMNYGMMNVDFGCIDFLRKYPYLIFRSPFIRPEDINQYENMCNIIKLAGRTGGYQYVMRLLDIYKSRKYTDNLMDLMDSTRYLNNKLFIFNDALPLDFINNVGFCDKSCFKCGYCESLFNDKNIVQIVDKSFFLM